MKIRSRKARLIKEARNELRRQLEQLTDQELIKVSPLNRTRRATNPPHPRQKVFLDLNCEEALYGGACGGGKTHALLLFLLGPIAYPGYSGIYFRRTYSQLGKSNDSVMTKAIELFVPLGGKYKSSERKWYFPSGATIEFGHLPHESSVQDYQGQAYHRIAFDELTQFSETQYTYLFSRLRKRADVSYALAVRAASNPGGPGHQWVKARFISPEAEKAIQQLESTQPSPENWLFQINPKRAFVPARLVDNPSLDIGDYMDRMQTQLSPMLRQRLLNGDWSAVEDAAIKPDWLRYYEMQGAYLIPKDVSNNRITTIEEMSCKRFATIDTAGTSEQRAQENKGKPASYSVVQIWEYCSKTRYLFLRHVWRKRVAWNDLKNLVPQVLQKWRPSKVLIENAHFGVPLKSELAGFQVELVNSVPTGMQRSTGKTGKLERATTLLNCLEEGRVFLPQFNNEWLYDLETEWLSWTGQEDETSDQIDTASYAARHVDKKNEIKSWGGVIH